MKLSTFLTVLATSPSMRRRFIENPEQTASDLDLDQDGISALKENRQEALDEALTSGKVDEDDEKKKLWIILKWPTK